jgi:hypothetical protein
MKKLHLICLASLAALGSTQTIAQNTEHFYGGVGLGQAQSKINNDRINNTLIGTGATTTSLSHENEDASYKVFGGYQINPNLGVEAGYFSLGEFGFKSTTNPTGTLHGRMKIDGMNVDLVGTMPVNDQLSWIGSHTVCGIHLAHRILKKNGHGSDMSVRMQGKSWCFHHIAITQKHSAFTRCFMPLVAIEP